jgi:hypothetical protein
VGNDGIREIDVLGECGYFFPPGTNPCGQNPPPSGPSTPGLIDNTITPPLPNSYPDVIPQATVDQWKSAVKNHVRSKIDCVQKSQTVQGYAAQADSGVTWLSTVDLATEDTIQITWATNGCDWSWTANLTASNWFGANGGNIPEDVLLWLANVMGSAPGVPAQHIQFAEWSVSDNGTCTSTSANSQ